MTLEELGAALRLEREKRGLQIEDVADHLKIGARLLRALEEGDMASLPHLAYTRGFVRSYSAYLGMSAEEVNEVLQTLSGESISTPQPVFIAPKRHGSGDATKWFAFILILLLVGGAYVIYRSGWLDILRRQDQHLALSVAPLSGAEQLEDTNRAASATASVPEALPVQEQSVERTGNISQGQPKIEPAQEVGPPQPASVPVITGTQHPDDTPPATELTERPQSSVASEGLSPTEQHRVVITATEECWIHSSADNTDTRQFSLRKGDTFALTFTKNLRVKLGNAGGVRIRYDGQEMPSPGTSGQVRTLFFPPMTD